MDHEPLGNFFGCDRKSIAMDESLAVVIRASDDQEAQLIAAILRGHGITVFVEGSSLMDEWAVSQRMLGQIGVEVKVPSDSLEKAQEILANARKSGEELSREEGSE